MSVLEAPEAAAAPVPPFARSWPLVVAVAAAGAAGLAIAVSAVVVPGQRDATPLDMVWLVSWLSFAVVGAVVLLQRPDHRGARAFLGVGTLVPLAGLVDVLAFWVADRDGDGATAVAWLRLTQEVAFAAGFALLLSTVLLLPDGVLARAWMRWPARAARAGAVTTVLASLLAPGPIGEDLPVDNPLGLTDLGGAVDAAGGVGGLLLVLGALTGVLSIVLRTRGATGATRSQLAWLAYGVLLATALNLASVVLAALGVEVSDDVGALVAAATLPVVPVCVAIGVLRHNLFDVELLLRRSLVYAVLSGLVLLAYLGIAAVLGSTADGAGPSALLGGLVALAALPLRTRGQAWLDRRFYGESGDPYAVLSGLARQLSAAPVPDEVPGLVARQVCTALRVPWAAVEVGEADASVLVAESGSSPGWAPAVVPLSVRGAEVGRLLVAPRSASESLEERDVRLLDDLARQVAVAVDGLRLTAELRRSREQLVLAREEERRRLRNDLHDGLGPVLAGVALQLAVLRDRTAEPAVGDVLEAAQGRLGGAVEELRRVVYGLRPPALDELGLVGALREQVTAFGGLEVLLDVPDPLPPLPAAIEVAAFRVAVEALTNVVRHSGAARCAVTVLVVGDHLVVEVVDDGRGLDAPAGVGRRSMAERCAEVGGALEVSSAAGPGTTVRACLPLTGNADA